VTRRPLAKHASYHCRVCGSVSSYPRHGYNVLARTDLCAGCAPRLPRLAVEGDVGRPLGGDGEAEIATGTGTPAPDPEGPRSEPASTGREVEAESRASLHPDPAASDLGSAGSSPTPVRVFPIAVRCYADCQSGVKQTILGYTPCAVCMGSGIICEACLAPWVYCRCTDREGNDGSLDFSE